MQTSNRLAFVLALALGTTATGCSTADSGHMAGDDGGGDDGSGTGSNSGRPLDASGTYTMHSTFDIASNVPGTAGTVVNTIIQATDDPSDPTKWVLDQVIAQISDKTIRGLAGFAEAAAADFLNTKVLQFAPDFVSTMILVGRDFGDVSKNFGLIETLTLTGSAGSYTATHTVTGAHFKIGTLESDYLLANYNVPNIVVNNVAVTMDATGALTIAAHDVPLAYGKLLRLALDGAIIPLIDNSAHNLNDLLAHLIDCNAVGTLVADQIGLLSASTYAGLCTTGLNAAAGFIYHEIEQIDGNALKFGLSGTARAMDTDGDRTVDSIVTGAWTGTLSYATTPTTLAPSTFFGKRN